MAKAPKTAYVCNDCGAEFSRWQGQCSACKAWNTISEAAKHGFKRAIVPFANKPKSAVENMEVFTVKKLADALAILDNF